MSERTMGAAHAGALIGRTIVAAIVVVAIGSCQIVVRPGGRRDDVAQPVAASGWIRFRPDARVSRTTVVDDERAFLELEPGSTMQLISSETDEIGMTHDRYQQYHQGVRIEGAELIVHGHGAIAETANGKIARRLGAIATAPRVPKGEARRAALRAVRTALHAAEGADGDRQSGHPVAEAAPRATELVITRRDGHEEFDGSDLVLAWRFDVFVSPREDSRSIYVDATGGEIVKTLPLVGECDTGGGMTTFRGYQRFNTRRAGDNFILEDDCNTAHLHVVNWLGAPAPREFSDADNNWVAGADQSPATSFWALGIAYDYFDLVHHRRGYDGKDASIELFHGQPGAAASGGGGQIQIGIDGLGPNDDFNTTDIVGHEFTHNVTETSAKLAYGVTESAALNESFSDIFGNLIEAWEEQIALPTDWRVGEDKGCGVCRDMSNPGNFNGPDTYQQTNWSAAGEPHTNGEVQNFWFYLVANGGSGTNDNGFDYSVTGIGLSKAGRIAYRTLTRYLVSSSAYADARNASIQAASDLFGPSSGEVAQVTNAWCAVGLCPPGLPTGADRFDTAGGNPNPASPNNNDTFGGATPIGASTAATWTGGGVFPSVTVTNLSIFPTTDVDYFEVSAPPPSIRPAVSGLGDCLKEKYQVALTSPATIRIYRNGQIDSTNVNTDLVVMPAAGSFGISVRRAFPGQIISYDLTVRWTTYIDESCIPQLAPPDRIKLIRECIMCDQFLRDPREDKILDPGLRSRIGFPDTTYYLYWPGGSDFRVGVDLVTGKSVRAELRDMQGQVVAVADTHPGVWRSGVQAISIRGPAFSEESATGRARSLTLTRRSLPEGLYALSFSHFGYGSHVRIELPSRGDAVRPHADRPHQVKRVRHKVSAPRAVRSKARGRSSPRGRGRAG